MKKSLVIALALVFVLGIAATAFAAANPFVDVPAKHWAYDAVNKLYKAGIVEGAAGKYMGDKSLTRYEMAQIIARAMAKSDKADAETKAILDKLQVEFAAELNNLGVRVAKLEANQPNIKFNGDFRTRYSTTQTNGGAYGPGSAQYRLRLEAVAKVDENSSYAMRFVTREPDKAAFGNTTWQTAGNNAQEGSNAFAIDRVNWTTKAFGGNATVGRQSIKVDGYDILMDSGAFSYDGIKYVAPVGKFTVTANYGRFLKGAVVPSSTDAFNTKGYFANLDFYNVAAASTAGKLNYSLGYNVLANPVQNQSIFKWTVANASYMFSDKLSMGVEYVNNDGLAIAGGNSDKDMYAAKVVYGDQALKKAGDQNFNLLYWDAGKNSMYNGFSSMNSTPGGAFTQAVNYKGYDAQFAHAFSKTFNFYLDYVVIDPETAVKSTKLWRGVAQVVF